jgi:TrbC/VIRB2 family pilin
VDRKAYLKGGPDTVVRRLESRALTLTFNSISTLLYKENVLKMLIDARLARRWSHRYLKTKVQSTLRTIAPCLFVLFLTSAAHAQGSMDFSGATTLMNTFKTFAIYAGAVICFAGLIFAGIRMMSGRFQDAIPGLFGALFGAGVLGWGAGWISSLTGQSVN